MNNVLFSKKFIKRDRKIIKFFFIQRIKYSYKNLKKKLNYSADVF